MKKARNELLMFCGGLAMFVSGLYIFSQKVVVHTSHFRIGGTRLSGGLIMVPLIAGLIWLFATNSIGSKILTALGAAFIILNVILSVDIHLVTMTLFDWIVLMVLIFGGLGLLARVLLAKPEKNDKEEMM